MLIHANENAFNKVWEGKGTFIADFFATWCGPCKMFSAVLEKAAPEISCDILKIDIDENASLADKYDVTVVPTVLFIKNGEIVHREEGFLSKDKFTALIEEHLK